MDLRKIVLAGAAAVTAFGAAAQPAEPQPPAPADDPYVWLEEIEGERALAWARSENERTLGELQGDPRYRQFHDRALEILQARDRIPPVSMRHGGLYNFWQDQDHVRGIWRRTSLESYRTDDPQWETVLDVDALARAENANWVYQGASCLPPEERRCLIILSDGGRDASVLREFDTVERRFVEDGFSLPQAKQSAAWIDSDTLLVARDWGPGTLTASGYPFVVKRLRRGQTIDQAEEVFRGSPDNVGAFPMVLRDAAGNVHGIGVVNYLTTFESEITLLTPRGR